MNLSNYTLNKSGDAGSSILGFAEISKQVAEADHRSNNPAVDAFDAIASAVQELQNQLDGEHEVGVRLASFNQDTLMHITHISYSAPAIINFHGFVNGSKAHLMQNVNQLNVLFIAVPKLDPDMPARRISFNDSESQA